MRCSDRPLTASVYIGGYFWLSMLWEAGLSDGKAIIVRFYKYAWLAEVLSPHGQARIARDQYARCDHERFVSPTKCLTDVTPTFA